MATRTDEVEAALIAALKVALVSVTKDVAAITREDVDIDTDNIVVTAPAVRIQFRKEDFAAAQDRNYLNYKSEQNYVALVGATRPATAAIERGAAQSILELVKDCLAGLRLTLASNPQGKAVVKLVSADLFAVQDDGTWFEVAFTVESFSGFAANIGGIR